jgi:phosphatidylglycerophosphate synthase
MTLKIWNSYHGTLLVVSFFLFLATASLWPVVLLSTVSFSLLWMSHWRDIKHLKPVGGWANRVTLIRFLGLVVLATEYRKLTDSQLTGCLILLVILDGIDGYVARKMNQQTSFGAYFDMETDALYVCLVSCILLQSGSVGYWILIPAFMRYFYVVLVRVIKLHLVLEKPNPFGATIAVLMFSSLAFAFVLPEKIGLFFLAVTTGLIFFSFVYSFSLLIKHKEEG